MRKEQGHIFFQSLADDISADMKIHYLARITKVHPPYVDVQPEWKAFEDGAKESELKDLPVMYMPLWYHDIYYPKKGDRVEKWKACKMKLSVGDEVIVMFMDREISSHAKGDYHLQSDRTHDATDGIVLPRLAVASDFKTD